MQKNYLYLLIFFLPFFLFAQNRVSIPTKNVERGKIDTIDVYGSFSFQNSGKLEIKLLFNAYLIDVKKVIGNPNYVIHEIEPNIRLDLSKLDSAVLAINSFDFQALNEGIFFKIVIEGLVYKDSITYIQPLEIAIDDSLIDFTKDSGMIIVRGPSVIPIPVTSIGYGYPSPTKNQIRFDFTLAKNTPVDFSVFSSNGKKIIDSNKNSNYFLIQKGSIEIPSETVLEPGEYSLLVNFPNEIASGVYYLQMRTSIFGPFYSKFMLLK